MTIEYVGSEGCKSVSWECAIPLTVFKLSRSSVRRLKKRLMLSVDDLFGYMSSIEVCDSCNNNKRASKIFIFQNEIVKRSSISYDEFRRIERELNGRRSRYSEEEIAIFSFLQSLVPLMKKHEARRMLTSVPKKFVKTKKQQVLLAA